MDDLSISSMLDKLLLLEFSAGADIHYRIMNPPRFNPNDVVSIQKLAKRMATFVGLDDLTFVVAFTKQKENVGAHIDLSDTGNDVFIELESDLVDCPQMIPSTLAHEICHKWLQQKNIFLPIEIENERLTDIATIYLGFGKLVLNGCESVRVWYEQQGDRKIKWTQPRRSGYLSLDEFALVYRFVLSMRQIEGREYLSDLDAGALKAIHRCDLQYSDLYSGGSRSMEGSIQSRADLGRQIRNTQFSLSDIHKQADYLNHSLVRTLYEFFESSHLALDECQKETAQLDTTEFLNPVIGFIKETQNEQRICLMRERVHSIASDLSKIRKYARSAGRYVYNKKGTFPPPSDDMFNTINCPVDGTKLRLPVNNGRIVATCPGCGYKFAYDSSLPNYPDTTQDANVHASEKRNGIGAYFRRLFWS